MHHIKSVSRVVFGVVVLFAGCATESLIAITAFTQVVDGRPSSRHSFRRNKMCFTKKDDGDQTPTENSNDNLQQKTWNPLRLAVLRLGLTEPAMTSPLNYGKYDGKFNCAYCGQLLFDSTSKFDSGTGWPSFWRTASSDSIQYKREFNGSLECQCKKCSSHLGHVFLDGPKPNTVAPNVLADSPTDDPRRSDNRYLPRYCMNGAALVYTAREPQST